MSTAALPLGFARYSEDEVELAPQPWGWVEWFVLCHTLIPLLVYLPGSQDYRVFIRVTAFGLSLAALLWASNHPSLTGEPHPARNWSLGIVAYLTLMLLHPTSNTLTASVAQVGLYVAILAPIVWVTRARVTPLSLRRVLLIFWVFNASSAAVGVLQVYYPGHFQPALSSVVSGQGNWYTNELMIRLADGERIIRPMGLTDLPGGAAQGGLYAIILGMGLLGSERGLFMRAACVGSAIVGLFCIYLSQHRSALVMAVVCGIAYVAALLRRRDFRHLMALVAAAILAGLLSFSWAVSVGGDKVMDKVATLVQESPAEVYYRNRGRHLEWTLRELLPRYPMGAGLGRWGMTNYYFGDNRDPERTQIWVEIQWTGWLLDGGVPLILLYLAAIAVTCRIAWRIAADRRAGDFGNWAAIVFAYDVGALALTFSYAWFIGQVGLEFWLINAGLFTAFQQARQGGEPLGQEVAA